MTFFPSVPDDGHLIHVFHRFGRGLDPLLALHDDVMRGESDLSIAERELISAYTSALNDCTFCYNAHKVYAVSFGIDEDLFDALIADVDRAPIDDKLKPLMKFAAKLTRTPAQLVQVDVDHVLEAGWSENALHDAAMVVNLFSFMNRVIFAHGLSGHDGLYRDRLKEAMKMSREERQSRNQSSLRSKDYTAFGEMVRAGKLPEQTEK